MACLRIRLGLSFGICLGPWFLIGCGQTDRSAEHSAHIQPITKSQADVPSTETEETLTKRIAVETPVEIDSIQGDVLFALLTSCSWTNTAPDSQHPFGFCPVGEGDSEFRFLASGAYEHLWHPLDGLEPVIKASGRWNLKRGHDKKWLACFDNGERHSVTAFENGSIQLDGWKYDQ